MKVLHCPVVIGNTSIILSKYLNQLGVESKTVSYFKTFIDYEGDINLNLDSVPLPERSHKIHDFFVNNELYFDSFDVIHYHFMDTLTFGTSFGGWKAFPEKDPYWELDYFKKKGKKIVFTTYGSDIRNNSLLVYYQTLFENKNKKIIRPPLNNRNQYFKNFEISKYADVIVHGDSSSLKNTPYGIMIPLIIDAQKLSKVKKSYPKQSENLLVFHSPTDDFKKGTKHILNAIESVKKRGKKINFKLVKGFKNKEMLEFFSKTKGIYIDQVNYAFGIATLENLFFDNLCLCSFQKNEFIEQDPKTIAPIDVFSSKGELEEKIIENYANFKHSKGEDYVRQNFSGEVIAQQYYELYQMLMDNQKIPFIISQQWLQEFGEVICNNQFAEKYYSEITDHLLKTKEYDKLQHEIHNGIGIANDIELFAKMAYMARVKGDTHLFSEILNKYDSAKFRNHFKQAEYINKGNM